MKELPKAYEPKNYEDAIYKKWEESGLFNPDNLGLPDDAPSYTIILPPPNVTGTLHMGHAAMLALEDILVRFHRMKRERALWVPGTDHAAIATQTKVEKIIKKEEGLSRHDLGREEFLKRVRKFAQDSHDTIVNQTKKMGSSLDWSREAYTLDETRNKAVNSVFKMMYDDGLIYRGERIVNWCPRCHSTLADDEVEHKEQKGFFYTFKYDKNFPISIATTRPETKLGDTAVAVNPKDERYKKYVGQVFDVDFCGVPLKIKVIADHNVDMEFGTGALGVTPAHSFVDWQMAEVNDLPIIKAIDEDGKIRDGFGKFSGKEVTEARELIVEELRNRGLIEKEEEINNNLSICYRCDTTIEPLPSLQWFIDVNKKIPRHDKSIKELSIEAVEKGVFGRKKINIIPERFEKNYFHWMNNLRDWCISRQIWFGHRIPIWYNLNSDLAEIYNQNPTGHRSMLQKSSTPIFSDDNPGKKDNTEDRWVQDPDTLDTWFSSGMWTFSTLASSPEQIKIENGKLVIDNEDFKKFHPTSVLETGYDILFFWVARMIIMTTYAVQDIPFQDVYLHGLVLDDKGKKMSKSKGNVIDPLDMIEKYGTDATRLSLVVGSTPGNDMRLSEEKIASFRNLVNKIWNIFRYVISNYELKIRDYELGELDELTEADKWILTKMKNLILETTSDLEKYSFSQAGERLKEFTWNDLADWYLEAIKFEKNPQKADILSIIFNDLLKLWHPFIPFITEVIWNELGYYEEIGALMKCRWPNVEYYKNEWYLKDKELQNNNYKETKFDLVINVISSIRNARSENQVEPAKKIKAVIYAGDKLDLIESQSAIIKGLKTGIEELEIKVSGEKIADEIYAVAGGVEIYLIGAVDTEKEKTRIAKEIVNLEKVIKNLETKLSNQEFIDRAPAEIVGKEKEKLENYKIELEKLGEQMKNL